MPAKSSHTTAAEPRNVLVVDDDDDLREVVCTALEAEGYVVEAANDGRAALDHLGHLGRADLPDLVLLDLEMPVMDGWELIRRLRAVHRWNNLRVLVMSGAPPDDAPAGVPFIAKPANVRGLLAAVREATAPEAVQRRDHDGADPRRRRDR